MRGYKGFESDWTCRGFQYEIGKEYTHDGDIALCESGFHFCKTMAQVFSYYYGTEKKFAEVEALGEVIEGDDKCVTDRIKIVREIPYLEAVQMTNTGDCNTGNWNTGDWNTGDWNTGNRNTGDWNTGNWNTGDWNSTNFSSGCFCTEEPEMLLFDKPSGMTLREFWNTDAYYILNDMPTTYTDTKWVYTRDMTDKEKADHPEHTTTGGYLKTVRHEADRQKWWNELSADDKKTVMDMPNFDAEKFKTCTGIEVRE